MAVLILLSAIGFGCERKRTPVTTAPSSINWTNLLNTSRSTILTGRWEYAEASWMDLRLKKNELTDSELESWLRFQVDVLEQTKSDPLKEEIRIMAVQELGTTPKLGIVYHDWLKDALTTNLFTEPKVKQKAQEVLKELELSKP
ncbi:MAG TPA: hypothetical protein VK742_10885 [Candidatus Sulfotelmatobacter sp.]|nr:hypothetical protein [Candidatus Sulfotelmatobacter sp.]